MKILNFGSLNLDYVYAVDHFVRPGETISALKQDVNCGGKGLNQSIALVRAGAETYHAGCIGAGGERLKEMLVENGVNVDYLRTVSEIQGNAVIQVEPSGQNCILLFGGSNQCLTEAQITETLDHFEAGDYLVLQNEVNLLPFIVDEAYKRGMNIVLNPSPFDAKLDAVDFSKISWFLVNELEAAAVAGGAHETDSEAIVKDPGAAFRAIHEKYPKASMVITLGAEGCAAYRVTGEEVESVRFPAYRVKAVDTTAAGDTFTGYFIQAISSGESLEAAVQIATKASAISVTRPGAAASIPKKEEVNDISII